MRLFTDIDTPFFRKLSSLADLIYVNILFIICSLPIITAGASITAAMFVTRKIYDGDDVRLTGLFFSAFRMNFRQATAVWLIYIFVLVGLFLDYVMFLQSLDESYHFAVMLVLTVILFIVLAFGAYIFPLISRYSNSLKIHAKNAFVLSFAYLPRTALMIFLNALPLLMPLFSPKAFLFSLILWIIAGFALVFLFDNMLLEKIFKQIESNSAAA